MTTIYVTKYALTKGILKIEAEVRGSCATARIAGLPAFFHHGQWTTDEAAALRRAEELRQARITNLTKALEKTRKQKIKIREDL